MFFFCRSVFCEVKLENGGIFLRGGIFLTGNFLEPSFLKCRKYFWGGPAPIFGILDFFLERQTFDGFLSG